MTALELGRTSGSGLVPFGRSPLDCRVCFGEPDTSDGRGVEDGLLAGDTGRSADDPAVSRSLDLPLPNPWNAELRFEEDFRSGDGARP